jgi:hypothetical protein
MLSCLALGRKLSAPFVLFALLLGGFLLGASYDVGGLGNAGAVLVGMVLLTAFATVLPATTLVDLGRDALVFRTLGRKRSIRFADITGVHASGAQVLVRSRTGWVVMCWLPDGAEALIRARWREACSPRPSEELPALLGLVATAGNGSYRTPELPPSALRDPRVRIAAANALCAADDSDAAKGQVLRVAAETSDEDLRAALEASAHRARR